MKTIKEKVDFLRECAKKYEENGKSPLTDAEYDKLYEEVRQLAPDNPFFSEVGGEIDETHFYGKRVTHAISFGSLIKCADVNVDLIPWMKTNYKNDQILEFVLQYKIDGLSLGCVYKNGKLQLVSTRGDGNSGVDVTQNAQFIAGLPNTISCKDEVEVRGECYKDRADFYANFAGEYENPRNFCAGALNNIDPNVVKERGLSFVAYEVVRKDFDKETDKLAFLQKNKFETLADTTRVIKGTFAELQKEVKKYMDAINRGELKYSIDGVVLKINDTETKQELGYVANGLKPRANVAVKFPCEQVPAEIIGIEWNIGKTGKVCPVAILNPVRLNETTVQRVTLHNIKFITEMGLKIGSTILLQKSGEIIPYCVKKLSDGPKAKEIESPIKCPVCDTKLEWDATETSKVCSNDTCPAQLSGKIDYYFKTLGVKGVGPSTIDTLIERHYVYSLSDMYKLAQYSEDLSNLFGDKAFSNILNAIDAVKETTLAKFIEALGIGKIGTMAKEITVKAKTVEAVDALRLGDLTSIRGFAEIKAGGFLNGWKKMRDEIEKILQHIKIKEEIMASNKLDGKKFCFTGTFSKPRTEMQQMVSDNGGTPVGSVGKDVILVWDGEEMGSKFNKAKEKGNTIISESDFLAMIGIDGF